MSAFRLFSSGGSNCCMVTLQSYMKRKVFFFFRISKERKDFGFNFSLITITWIKSLMGQGLSVGIDDLANQCLYKVDTNLRIQKWILVKLRFTGTYLMLNLIMGQSQWTDFISLVLLPAIWRFPITRSCFLAYFVCSV